MISSLGYCANCLIHCVLFSYTVSRWMHHLRIALATRSTKVQKHQLFGAQPSLWSTSHIHTWLLEKIIYLTTWTFVGKVMSLHFNMLSRFVITFLPRSKYLFISFLQSAFAVILEPKKIKSDTASSFSPSICHEVMGPMPWS